MACGAATAAWRGAASMSGGSGRPSLNAQLSGRRAKRQRGSKAAIKQQTAQMRAAPLNNSQKAPHGDAVQPRKALMAQKTGGELSLASLLSQAALRWRAAAKQMRVPRQTRGGLADGTTHGFATLALAGCVENAINGAKHRIRH